MWKKSENEVISKITEDFEKIVAVTKSTKNLKDMPKTFYEIIKKKISNQK